MFNNVVPWSKITASNNLPELSPTVATSTFDASVGVIYTTWFPWASVSTLLVNVTVGYSASPLPAMPVARLLWTLPVPSVVKALAVTIEPSFTIRSFNLNTPVVGSTVNGAPAPNSHTPLAFFLAVYVTSVESSCFVKVTLTLSTFVWFVGVIKTSPLFFGVTVGAVGWTLNVTVLSILSGA